MRCCNLVSGDVVSKSGWTYVRLMATRLLFFLALLGLLLMPLGMGAPASASTPTSAMSQHCPSEQPDGLGKSVPGAHCAAGCAVVLPRPELGARLAIVEAALPASQTLASLDGLTPATGTRPPKAT